MTNSCTISATGITAPDYNTILTSIKSQVEAVYQNDIYLGSDSQDGQFLAIFAKAINDSNNATIGCYNNFSPATAQSAGLSSTVKINGIYRIIPTNSTANLTITGTIGTVITNGIAQDTNGNQWVLPASVTIPISGSITVTATCSTLGAITALANTIINIYTPTLGWQTVTNATDATVGNPVESDPALRNRQSISTSLPALTIAASIKAAIANLAGVTQTQVYVNSTGITDSNGIPAHSISCVVVGGTISAIVNAIAIKKSPGTGTYGTTSQVVIDSAGIPNTINYYAATPVPIDINITIKAYNGYVTSTGATIISQLTAYLNALLIGGIDYFVFNSKLYAPADDTGSLVSSYNVTALTMRRGANSFALTDIAIAFNELPVAGVITLTVV